MAKEIEVRIKPKLDPLDAVTVRPGDKLVVQMKSDFTREQYDFWRDRLAEQLPGVEVVFVAAEQMLVYRPDGDA
jgi:hypothetical protein